MGFSVAFVVSHALTVIGVAMISTSIALPFWVSRDIEKPIRNTNLLLSNYYKTFGIWSICDYVNINGSKYDQCVYYSFTYSLKSEFCLFCEDINTPIDREYTSVCSQYDDDSIDKDLFILTFLGQLDDIENGKIFLSNICSSFGHVLLSFTILSLVFGGLMLILILVSCCYKSLVFLNISSYFGDFSVILGIITISLWISLRNHINSLEYGSSFILYIIGFSNFCIASILMKWIWFKTSI